MNILSIGYALFVFAGLLIYYIIPQPHRYKWLIVQSFLFVVSYSPFGCVFILGTSLIVYRAALVMPTKSSPRPVLFTAMGACLAVLFLLKYLASWFPVAQLSIISKYLYPVGLSYYTLQVISYLLDVYWGRINPEKSFCKVLLFTSYFPQLIQGPISKFSELSKELFKPISFEWKNVKYGVQRILWGSFKKMVIADRLGVFVHEAFWNGKNTPTGLTIWLGVFFYTIQLYCDFSGGIDIIHGVSECYGIGLKENFSQPFFSHSLGEFWRRWHISLGEWMKDYVFYPVSTSNAMAKLKKTLKKHYNRKTATRVAIAIANIIVFTLVGLWHGSGSNFLAWGLYNGVILALGGMLEESFVQTKEKLHIRSESIFWHSFCLIRTFIIVMLGNIFDCVTNCGDAIKLFLRMFDFRNFFSIGIRLPKIGLLMVAILLVVDLLHEKHISIRHALNRSNFWVQVIFWTVFIQLIACFGKLSTIGGFLYANF